MNKVADCVPGGDNRLAVVVRSYDNTHLQCLIGPIPSLAECLTIGLDSQLSFQSKSVPICAVFGVVGHASGTIAFLNVSYS